MVRLAIYDSDFGRDDFMGEAALTWKSLMTADTHELPVKGQIFDPQRAGEKAVAVKKRMDAYAKRFGLTSPGSDNKRNVEKKPADSKSARRVSDASRKARRRSRVVKETPTLVVRVWHVARVRLHLSSAHELRSADVGIFSSGKSDPYATVRYQGKTIAKTKVQKNTLDPLWYACFELEIPTFQPVEGAEADALVEIFDYDLAGSDDFLGCVAISQDMMLRPHYGDVFELGPRPNAKVGDPMPTGFVNLKIECSYIPHSLQPVLWPRAPSLGQSEQSQKEDEVAKYEQTWAKKDIRTAIDEETGRRYWYEKVQGALSGAYPRWWYDPRPLPPRPSPTYHVPNAAPRPSPTKRKYARCNEPKPGDPGYKFRPTAVVEVNVLRARNLRKADRFGKSDPYAAIRYGPAYALQTVGRTRIVNNCLDPVWGDCPLRFPLPLDVHCGDQNLVIELWDSDNNIIGGRDDALGMCTITPKDYLNAIAPIRTILRPQPGEPPVSGWVEVRTSLLGRVSVAIEDITCGPENKVPEIKKRLVFAPTLTGWKETKVERERLPIQAQPQSTDGSTEKSNEDGSDGEKSGTDDEAPKGTGFDVDVPLQREGMTLEIEALEPGRLTKRSLGVASISGEDLLKCGTDRALDVPVTGSTQSSSSAFVSQLRLRVDCPSAVERLATATRSARELQETCNKLPQLAAIEVDILRASNLKQADAFSLSDPFVVGWWCGSRVGKTDVKSNTLNPRWDDDASATFRLQHVRTVNDELPISLGGVPVMCSGNLGLLLEVFDSDGPGRRGDFLGHCHLKHEDLMSAGKKELPLCDRDKLVTEAYIAHNGSEPKRRSCIRSACGICCAPCRLVVYVVTFPIVKLCRTAAYVVRTCLRPCLKQKPVTGTLLVRIRHHAMVRLRIMEGYGLPAADATITGAAGKSDPYCVVQFRGKKIAKTKVRANTSDPCFYEELDLSLEVPITGSSAPMASVDGQQYVLPWDHPGRAFQPVGNDALLISLYDHDTLSADDFLGQIVIRSEFLLRPQNGTHWRLEAQEESAQSHQRRGFLEVYAQTSRIPGSLEPVLRRQHGVLGTYREAVDGKTGRRYHFDVWSLERFWVHPAEIAKHAGKEFDDRGRQKLPCIVADSESRRASVGAMKPADIASSLTLDANDAQAVISVLVARARNLAAADVTGRSDPYAVVKFGNRRIGQTSVKSKTLDPEWMEVVPIVVPLSVDQRSSDITIEIYDHDNIGADDFLGAAHINTRTLLDNPDQVLSLPLSGKPGGKSAKGEVTVHLMAALKTVIEILSADHKDQLSDSKRGWYCVASWHGRQEAEVARTSTVYDGRLSRWNQCIATAVPLRFPRDRFRLEIREHNRFGRDKFVGKVELDASTLLAEMPRNEHTGDLPVMQYVLRSKDAEGLSKPRKRPKSRGAANLKEKSTNMIVGEMDTGEADDAMTPLVDGEGDGNGEASGGDPDDIKSDRDEATEQTMAREKRKKSFLGSVWSSISCVFKSSPKQHQYRVKASNEAKVDPNAKSDHATADQRAHAELEMKTKRSRATELAKRREEEQNRRKQEVEDTTDGSETGDVLSIRIMPSRAACHHYASAVMAWRQRPSANILPKTYAELEILCADSLRRADFLGKSDPFVDVSAGGTHVGRTRTVKGTLNPKWVDERFSLPQFSGSTDSPTNGFASRVELRVMDEDTVSASDLLGYVRLEHADLLGDGTWQTRDLGPDPDRPVQKAAKKRLSTSESAKGSGLGSLTFRVKLVVQVRLTIIGAYDLALNASVLDSMPDPYAFVKYHEKTWGKRTGVQSDTRRPLWYHAVELRVPVPADGVYGEPASIVVYDKNTLSDTEIGTATIPHKNLVYPHDHPGTLAIFAPGSSDEIKGWIEVQIEASRVPGRVEPRRRPNEVPVFKQAVDPRNDRPYWYDTCTGEWFSFRTVVDPERDQASDIGTTLGRRRRRSRNGSPSLGRTVLRIVDKSCRSSCFAPRKGSPSLRRTWRRWARRRRPECGGRHRTRMARRLSATRSNDSDVSTRSIAGPSGATRARSTST